MLRCLTHWKKLKSSSLNLLSHSTYIWLKGHYVYITQILWSRGILMFYIHLSLSIMACSILAFCQHRHPFMLPEVSFSFIDRHCHHTFRWQSLLQTDFYLHKKIFEQVIALRCLLLITCRLQLFYNNSITIPQELT